MNYLTKILIAWRAGFVIFGLVVVSIGLVVGSVIDAITFFSLFYLIATIIALAGISLWYILKWLMDYIKFQTNLSKDYSLENMNNLLKQFCEIHNVTCKQSLIIKYHKGVTKYLSTNDGKPLTLYKNNIIIP